MKTTELQFHLSDFTDNKQVSRTEPFKLSFENEALYNRLSELGLIESMTDKIATLLPEHNSLILY